ncbi:hypothetical protein QJQ45_030479 [Haematococcus lacustris]|nr:hypothetical protein QJQ45_030479 [Haematococcus lacustris]
MMTRGKVGKMLGGDQRVDLLAVYLSALIHDFEHKGVNNQYLITTGDELALRYNDHSPMENHHIAAAFQLLLHDETNFFTNTNSKVREVIRRYVIELVLATDMKQAGVAAALPCCSQQPPQPSPHCQLPSPAQHWHHFAFNSMFNNKTPTLLSCIVGAHEAETSPVLMGAPSCRHPSLPGHGPELGKPLGEHPSPQVSGSLPTPPPLGSMGNKGQGVMDDDLRLLTLQMVMKVSDLGHLAHAKDVHRRWVQLLEEELFRQGDLEVAAGLPVSPLMDRTKAGVTRSQAGFFSLVCLPQLQAFTTVFSGCQPMLDQARENNQMWLEEARLQGEASPAPGLSGSPSRRYGPAVLPLMLSKADDGEDSSSSSSSSSDACCGGEGRG